MNDTDALLDKTKPLLEEIQALKAYIKELEDKIKRNYISPNDI